MPTDIDQFRMHVACSILSLYSFPVANVVQLAGSSKHYGYSVLASLGFAGGAHVCMHIVRRYLIQKVSPIPF